MKRIVKVDFNLEAKPQEVIVEFIDGEVVKYTESKDISAVYAQLALQQKPKA